MLAYLQYLNNRYLNEKGQGMVEYAVIVAVVIAIGVALLTGTGSATLAGYINDVYKAVFGNAATQLTPAASSAPSP